MTVEEMAEQIIEAVGFWGSGTSFVDLENEIGEAMHGDRDMLLPGRPNSVLWTNVNQEFAEAFAAAVRSKRVRLSPSNLIVYAHDGKILSKPPIAEKLEPEDFTKPRWVPVTLSPAKAKT